jgi:hypothetical protein
MTSNRLPRLGCSGAAAALKCLDALGHAAPSAAAAHHAGHAAPAHARAHGAQAHAVLVRLARLRRPENHNRHNNDIIIIP